MYFYYKVCKKSINFLYNKYDTNDTCDTKSISRRKSHKLNEEQKKKIWKMYNDGLSPKEIAKLFKITRLTVYRIGKDGKYKN